MLADGFLEKFVGNFEGGVVARHQRFHALAVHVEADGRIFRGKQAREREADVAEADHADPGIFNCRTFHITFSELARKGNKNLAFTHARAYKMP